MKIGLFPGSFNPIHIGHLLIATFMAEEFELDKIWFIVSPHNPLKKWKDYNRIIDENQILVYNRADNISDKNFIEHKNIHFKKLPQLDISSTMIRERIKTEKSIDFMVTNEVKNYIIKQKLYK